VDFIQHVPVLIRILSSLVLILLINQFTGLLPLAILIGTVLRAF